MKIIHTHKLGYYTFRFSFTAKAFRRLPADEYGR